MLLLFWLVSIFNAALARIHSAIAQYGRIYVRCVCVCVKRMQILTQAAEKEARSRRSDALLRRGFWGAAAAL